MELEHVVRTGLPEPARHIYPGIRRITRSWFICNVACSVFPALVLITIGALVLAGVL
jgi:hypothetical protein